MASAQACRVRSAMPRFEAGIVRDGTRVAQAQRFRDGVIERRTGARPVEDRFDAHCEHLVGAGELVWRDRDRRTHEIIDATPSPDWMFLVPKTMAVTLVIGNSSTQIRPSLFTPGYTLASAIANQFTEADKEIYFSAVVEIALVLLLVAGVMNVVARLLVWGVRGPLGSATRAG